ncbi:Shikimate dehydrogenase [Pseudomonas coronafaciens pv. coronafaciens]|nr:Shikimate dehydrogenase [Pseudomonas coronafaciens pv. coronafaciens]
MIADWCDHRTTSLCGVRWSTATLLTVWYILFNNCQDRAAPQKQETYFMTHADNTSVLAGLIGTGIQASRTPAMHEHEGDAQGMRYLYRLIDIDTLQLDISALPQLVDSAQHCGFTGLNITFPCKQAVIPLLDELSDEARGIGAVNTVVFKDGKRVGHNTDCLGFAEGFQRGLEHAARQRVVQMGAGGAGAAVAHALLTAGVERLTVFEVDPQRAQGLVDNLNGHFGAGRAQVGIDLPAAMAEADGLVNTTPVGMAKLPGTPLPVELLRAELWVAEIIYFPLETELLRQARALGCRTLDGSTMAVFQAVKAFELFSGQSADASRMMAHFHTL